MKNIICIILLYLLVGCNDKEPEPPEKIFIQSYPFWYYLDSIHCNKGKIFLIEKQYEEYKLIKAGDSLLENKYEIRKGNKIKINSNIYQYDNEFKETYLKINSKLFNLKSYYNSENQKIYTVVFIYNYLEINKNNQCSFIIKVMGNHTASYTFFEYQKEKLVANYFIEDIDSDEKRGLPQEKTDTIIKIISKKINIPAEIFFNESFIFDSIKTSNTNYNYLTRNEKWQNKPSSRQEKWVLEHFLSNAQ